MLANAPNNFFALKLSHFFDLKTQQRYILRGEVNFTKKEFNSSMDSLHDFHHTFDGASMCLQNLFLKPNLKFDLQRQKTIYLPNALKKSMEIQVDKILYRFD